jgi:hypothetical protein
MRRCFIPIAVATAVLVMATPAAAITGGEPDAGHHPYVALMQTYDEHNIPLQVCSGALVSPTLFLTAGHCVGEPHATNHAEVWFVEDISSVLDINYLLALFFEPNFTGSCTHVPKFTGYPCKGDAGGRPYAHPDYCFECGKGVSHQVTRDVAVVTLDDPVPVSKVGRYAQLPQPRQVDHLANRSLIDLVGFGVQYQRDLPGKLTAKPPPSARWAGAGSRVGTAAELVTGRFEGSDERIRLTANDDEDTGGLCFGDSGGPDLVHGTDTVVAVNSFVTNYNCKGVVYSERVDPPEVLAWIAGFMK